MSTDKIINDAISKVLLNQPLYKKSNIPTELSDPCTWNDKRIKQFCEIDKSEQTFEIGLALESKYHYDNLLATEKAYPPRHKDHKDKINFVVHLQGLCTYCQQYKIDFMVNIIESDADTEKYYAQKIGAFPPFEITPGRDILNYLSDEHQEYYKKALMNLSSGYGIGAFSYFRRITEELIRQIVQELISADLDSSDKIKIAWEKYQKDRAMSNLIDTISPYIPASLFDVGDNPLKLIYGVSSQGIHQYSDMECVSKSQALDKIFRYLITQMNTKMQHIKEVRKAIKELSV